MIPINLQPIVLSLASIFSGPLGFVWTLLLVGILTWQTLMEAYGRAKPARWVRILGIITVALLVAFGLNVILRFAQILQSV